MNNEPLDKHSAVTFGANVRRRRLALGLSLERFAELVGLTPNYLGTVECGRRDPSLSSIVTIAKGLDIEPGELFRPIADPSPQAN